MKIPETVRRNSSKFRQTPQCEGIHDSRIFFNNKLLNRHSMLYPVKMDKGTAILQAGEVQGITSGSLFSIFSTENMTSVPLGSLVAHDVRPFSTVLHRLRDVALFRIPSPAWALQTQIGDNVFVNVAIPAENDFLPVIRHIKEAGNGTMIRIVEDQSHEIAVVGIDGCAGFVLTDEKCCENNLRRLPIMVSLDVDEIYSILSHAAHFFWDLRRLGKKPTLFVTLEAYEVIVDYALDSLQTGSIFNATGKNLSNGNAIKISLQDGTETRYGFKLISSSSQSLYVWIFSFNMANLSVGAFKLSRDPHLISTSIICRYSLQTKHTRSISLSWW